MDQRLQPPAFVRWTDGDEAQLEEKKKMKIDIKDTALGRHRATMKRQLLASVAVMTPEERDQLQLEMKKCKAVSPPQGAETDPPRSNTNSSEAPPRLTQIRQMRVVLVGRLRRAADGKRFRINNCLIYHVKIPLTYLLLVRQHSNRSRITFGKSNANRPCARLRKRDGYQANFAAVNSSVQTDTIAKV